MDGAYVLEDDAVERFVELLRELRGEEEEEAVVLREDAPGRHELTDEEWAVVAPLLPEPRSVGRRARSNRQMLNGMLWILRTGAPWRDLPRDRFGPFTTVHTRFVVWRRDGLLDRLVERLLGLLNDAGKLDWDLWCVDGSVARAARCAGGYPKRGGRRTSRRTTLSAGLVEEWGRNSTS